MPSASGPLILADDKALFIWSRVPETTLPPCYPGRANFSLISLKNSTNCLHENANSSRGGETTRDPTCRGETTRPNPVRRDNIFSYKHFGSPTRGEMAQIVSGARHFVQYVTCLAVSRETSVLEGTIVTTHNAPQSCLERKGCLGSPRPYKQGLKVFTTRVFVSFLIAFTDISQHEPSPRREIDHYLFTLLSTREMYSTV